MRKDYEQRLEDLAESKRQALREINKMFETRLEEKDLVLQEVKFYYLHYLHTYPKISILSVYDIIF